MPLSLEKRPEYYKHYYNNPDNLWRKQARQRRCYWANTERRMKRILQMKEYRDAIKSRKLVAETSAPKTYTDRPVEISREPVTLSFD